MESTTLVASSLSGSAHQTEFIGRQDLVLQSSDGRAFSAYSLLFSLASPRLASMVNARGVSGSTIHLPETGEIVELMLEFIHPGRSPTIPSFDVLEKALRAAEKYQLNNMKRQLRLELLQPGSPVSIYTHPIDALLTASTFGFQAETKLALSQIQGQYDCNTVDGLKKLAAEVPAAVPYVVLIGAPSVKHAILFEVLFNFKQEPMYPSGLHLCRVCAHHLSLFSCSPPEWLARWARALLTELKKRPTDDWKPCFEVPFLFEAVSRHGGIPVRTVDGTCTCLDGFSASPGFLQWSSKVHDFLVARLAGVKELEELIV